MPHDPVTGTSKTSIGELACSAAEALAGGPVHEVHLREHSNDVAEIRFADGRVLMVKQARYDWAAAGFRATGRSATLIRTRTGILTPEPLNLPEATGAMPLLAYWRIPLPTLAEVWPELHEAQQRIAVQRWGQMIRRMHGIRQTGFGPIHRDEGLKPTLQAFLHSDLEDRLEPAMRACWPGGLEPVCTLIAMLPALYSRAAARTSVFLHNDLHAGNVLCTRTRDGVANVGLLDLDDCHAGPPESDLAVAAVLHGPLFEQELPTWWFGELLHGYGTRPDPVMLAFFRVYHLLNMGFFSGLLGHDEHAGRVAEAVTGELRRLERLVQRVPANPRVTHEQVARVVELM